jgi:hypothetical protein
MNQTYYDQKLETLPENLKYSVMMSGWKSELVKIQSEFKLHIDQTQVLEDSTIKLMFGDIDAPDFISNMFNEAHINSEKAADILLAVDLKILKKIRERLQIVEDSEKDEEDIENFFLDDDEKLAREENKAIGEYYAELERIREEDDAIPEQELEEEEEEEEEIPTNINKEREDLLSEINAPSKSFINENKIIEEYHPIPVDHQLENVQLEEPFKEENIVPKYYTKPEAVQPNSTLTEKKQEKTSSISEIKKPVTINLSDVYREPIE